MKSCIVFAFLFLQAMAFADPPVAKVQGPNSASPGDIVILDASASNAKHYSWLVDASGVDVPTGRNGDVGSLVQKLESLGFKVERPATDNGPNTHLMIDGGKKLLLASYPGVWRISLAVSDDSGVSQIPWTVTVGGSPPPKPKPDDPDVPPPDPPADLTADAKRWLATVPADALSAKKSLRESLRSIGMKGGEIGSIVAIDALLTNNVTAALQPLGNKAGGWESFFQSADAALENVKAKGGGPAEYGAALVQIAKALE